MFRAENIGDGSISVTHSGSKYLLVSAAQARRMGLGGGRWELEPVAEEERGCWLQRTKNGSRVLVTLRRPDGLRPVLVRDFCWDIFSKTTGLILEPGAFGKFRLKEVPNVQAQFRHVSSRR